ncbi:MAG: tRNA pseudouridine(13) synthase TruD [Sulfurovum sp.]|nr:tRNA pseudouridine(13) synthase TruD [Sulfurovum sp.]
MSRLSCIITTHAPDLASQKLDYPLDLVKALAKQTPFFKLFLGDVIMPYPHGKLDYVKDMLYASQTFTQKKISPTGLLCGATIERALSDAYYLEEPYDDSELASLRGDRRFAWIWPEEIMTQYNANKQQLQVGFYLPKGSYATTFLEEIGKFSLKEK